MSVKHEPEVLHRDVTAPQDVTALEEATETEDTDYNGESSNKVREAVKKVHFF